jgi:hypothetical protein
METPVATKRDSDSKGPRSLPEGLQGRCREIAREIEECCGAVRDGKILAARVRICSGYYDSEEVLHIIADRLLAEGQTPLPSS